MSMYDRDWYRESYKEKEEKYGGDFSLHSKPKKKHQKRKADKTKIIQLIKDQPTETQLQSRMTLYFSLLTLVAPFSL